MHYEGEMRPFRNRTYRPRSELAKEMAAFGAFLGRSRWFRIDEMHPISLLLHYTSKTTSFCCSDPCSMIMVPIKPFLQSCLSNLLCNLELE